MPIDILNCCIIVKSEGWSETDTTHIEELQCLFNFSLIASNTATDFSSVPCPRVSLIRHFVSTHLQMDSSLPYEAHRVTDLSISTSSLFVLLDIESMQTFDHVLENTVARGHKAGLIDLLLLRLVRSNIFFGKLR